MRLMESEALDFCDVMMVPQRSDDEKYVSRKDVDITRTFKFKHSDITWNGIPICASNMDSVSSFKMSETMNKFGMMCALHKFHNSPGNFDNLVHHLDTVENSILSIGISDNDFDGFERVFRICKKRPFWVCIDVANGYTRSFRDFVKKVRAVAPEELVIIAGNVVTKEMTQAVIEAGADIVKIGIGSGGACTTRRITGVGFPQFSALLDCVDGAHGLGAMVISDGGCKTPGDIGKAFGVGADFVMLGSMLAGHKECLDSRFGINLIEKKEPYWERMLIRVDNSHGAPIEYAVPTVKTKKYIQFRGMSSKEVMDDHYNGVADYRASEGKQVLVSYKGSVEDTLKEICGGLRSACTYLAAKKLKEMHRRATFIKVRRQLNDMFK